MKRFFIIALFKFWQIVITGVLGATGGHSGKFTLVISAPSLLYRSDKFKYIKSVRSKL